MKLFKKQETPTGTRALLGIFAAVMGAFSIILAVIPLSSLLLGLFLPLVSAVASYYTENKYLPAYVIGASALCLGLTFFNWGDTLFVVIPSIFAGSFYGFLRDKKIPSQYIIILTSVVQTLLNVAAFYILLGVTGVNIFEVLMNALQLPNDYIIPGFIVTYSIAETILSFFIIEGVINKFSKDAFTFPKERFISPALGILFGGLSLGFAFIEIHFSYVFMVLGIYFALVGSSVLFENKPIWVYILGGVLLLLSLFLFALLNKQFPQYSAINLASIFFISISLTSFVSIFVNKKGTMNS